MTSTSAGAFTLPVDENHPFGLYYDDEAAVAVENSEASAEFLFEIPEKHYLYRESLRVETDDGGVSVVLDLPPSETKHDPFLEKDVEVYFHQLVVPARFKFSGAAPGEITGRIFYQGCSSNICFRLMKQEFRIPLAGAAPAAAGTGGGFPASAVSEDGNGAGLFALLSANDLGVVLRRGLAAAFAVAFLAGLVTAFTPCVLPVIPLTLAFMGVSDGRGRGDKTLSLVIFTSGMVAMYATLGVVSALLGKTLGFWFQSVSFQAFLIAFFVTMGLWMWGAFDLSLPAALQNRIVRYQPRGHWRNLYAGLTVGFLAAPCVGPVAGPLLVYISASKDAARGALLMTGYALGLSVLFFALGFFSRDWVQRFGARSGMVKKVLGILLMATAAFYGYVLAKPYLADARGGDGFFLASYETAEKEAARSGKGVLVDFYADWCLPCHEWDESVWSDAAARDKIRTKFVPVKIDCTRETPACEEAVGKFGVIGWPTVVFLDRSLKEVPGSRIVGQVMDAGEFLKHLEGVSP